MWWATYLGAGRVVLTGGRIRVGGVLASTPKTLKPSNLNPKTHKPQTLRFRAVLGPGVLRTIGALTIRIGFWGLFWCSCFRGHKGILFVSTPPLLVLRVQTGLKRQCSHEVLVTTDHLLREMRAVLRLKG